MIHTNGTLVKSRLTNAILLKNIENVTILPKPASVSNSNTGLGGIPTQTSIGKLVKGVA